MKFNYKNSAKIPDEFIQESSLKLSPRINALRKHSECSDYADIEDFLHLPFDRKDSQIAKEIKNEYGKNLKWIFVIGIGGANLGAQAITLALRYSVPANSPKILFFDTPDPYFINHFENLIKNISSKDEFVVLVISKSGKTVEVIANANKIISLLENKFEGVDGRVIVLSQEDSPLWKAVEEKKVKKIALRPLIPDRYSVFSSTALVPLALGGMDIDDLLAGAREALKVNLSSDTKKNRALISATLLDFYYQKGIHIRDFFFFNPELEYVGKWSRQLIAESLGKVENNNGDKVNSGITPTVSIGTTDLHSMAELYLSGPNDRFTTFIQIESAPKMLIDQSDVLGSFGRELSTKSTQDIISAIYDGYKESVSKKERPFTEIVLPDLSTHSIGVFMQTLMVETLLLAQLWNVNPFNQPGVEEYKISTRTKLYS